jgi:hypothetical protein
VDDCLSDRPGPCGRHVHLLDTYRRNWLLPSLMGFTALASLAQEKGFCLTKERDLTACLRLGRLRDRAISILAKCVGRFKVRGAYLRSLLDGDARQKCYRGGLIQYRLLVFEKQSPKL